VAGGRYGREPWERNVNDRDARIADKLNNARTIARGIQASMSAVLDDPHLYTCDVDCDEIIRAAVRAEELMAEAVQLLRSES